MKKILRFSFIIIPLFVSMQLGAQNIIWPGDVTNNGEVDMVDLLLIGRANGSMGMPRDTQGFPWMALNFIPWNQSFANGTNYGYADSDGNGLIEATDVFAVDDHYGKTHGIVTPDQFNQNPSIDTLSFFIDSPSQAPAAGTSISIPISLNFPTDSTLSVHGMILTLLLDSNMVDMDFITMSYSNSIFNAQNMPPFNLLKVEGNKVVIGIAKFDQIPVMNSGPIGSLNVIIEENVWDIAPDPTITVAVESAVIIDNDLLTIFYEGASLTFPIDQLDNTTEVKNNDFLIYPNPATNRLIIESKVNNVQEIKIFDLLGRNVMSFDGKQFSSSITHLEVGHLNPGLFTIFIHTDEGILQRKFIKN